jgi:hypothetical protein
MVQPTRPTNTLKRISTETRNLVTHTRKGTDGDITSTLLAIDQPQIEQAFDDLRDQGPSLDAKEKVVKVLHGRNKEDRSKFLRIARP